ncbi:MAG: PAS domain S-box protein [Methylovulum sp.]|nr:MAG: PAS domain S-box protein [Methylovulum sp.]
MDKPVEELRILILEDTPSDAELEEIELRDAELLPIILRVETRKAFEQALAEFKPNIILADYKLPAYSGRDALEFAHRTHPEIPVIMVTGALGDEAAVELLKLGAMDYVLKDHLVRLAPAIKRALSEESDIRERKIAESKYRALFTEAMDGIVLIDCGTWHIVDCNPEFEKQTGRTLAQLKELKAWAVLPAEQHELARQTLVEIREAESGRGSDFNMQKPDGKIVPIEFSAKLLNIQQQRFIQGITRDITERKRAENALRESEERYRFLFENMLEGYAHCKMLFEQDEPVDFIYLSINSAFEKITGLKDVIGKRVSELIPGIRESNPELLEIYGRVSLSGQPEKFETYLAVWGMWLAITAYSASKGYFVAVFDDITERKRAEDALRRANRALRTLSAGNLALVRAANEDELLRAVTNVIVEEGGYRLAVVDYAEDDPEKSIMPKAWSGSEGGHYWTQGLSWADTEQGQLPVAKAIRTGIAQICHDLAGAPAFKPWKDAAVARGYVSNIAMPLSGDGRIFGGLSIYSSEADAFDDDEVQLLVELANDLAYGIVTLRTRAAHEQQASLLRQSLEQSIQTIAATVEARDPYTAGHQRRVGELATAIAGEMGLAEEQIHGIHFAAIIHDLGKIRVPAEILSKPGKLTHNEYMLIKDHPQAGYDILKNVKYPWPIADIVLQHHEKLDGSGYPQGLTEGQILLEARILTVADVVEAISSHRPYRPGLGIDTALEEIERNRGRLYDPRVVDACIRLFRELAYKLPV